MVLAILTNWRLIKCYHRELRKTQKGKVLEVGQVGPKPETHTVRRGGISVKRPSKANGKAYEGATGAVNSADLFDFVQHAEDHDADDYDVEALYRDSEESWCAKLARSLGSYL